VLRPYRIGRGRGDFERGDGAVLGRGIEAGGDRVASGWNVLREERRVIDGVGKDVAVDEVVGIRAVRDPEAVWVVAGEDEDRTPGRHARQRGRQIGANRVVLVVVDLGNRGHYGVTVIA
jgi:hypothetical protein